MNDRQFERLPKYAQREITMLRELTKRDVVEDMSAGDTRVRYDDYGISVSGSLPDHARVIFLVNDDRMGWIEIMLRDTAEGTHVLARSGSRLIVEPEASNSVRLRYKR